MNLFDTHVHLNAKRFSKDGHKAHARALDAGVARMCNVFLHPDEYERMPKFMKGPEYVYSIGIHPHYADEAPKEVLDRIESHAKEDDRVVAIGEIGLDYYRDLKPRNVQKETFIRQMLIAERTGLPMIIHARDAEVEAMKLLRKKGFGDHKVLFHAWCGDKAATDMLRESKSWIVGVGGSSTYKQNAHLRAALKGLPLKRVVLETDCPWLGPGSKRKERNEPANIIDIAESLAGLTGATPEEVAEVSFENANVFFGLTD